ncbi:hypothetical protein ACWDRB_62660 [Nonomuraea sp. NPDC003707]
MRSSAERKSLGHIQPYLAVGLHVLPEQRGQPTPVGEFEQLSPLAVGQDVLQHQGVDVFTELLAAQVAVWVRIGES